MNRGEATKRQSDEATKGNAHRSVASSLSRFLPAFTLIEIMLAIVLLALLASGAALSFNQPIRRAREQDAMEMVRSFDDAGRRIARRLGHPVLLQFDLSTATLVRLENGQSTYRSVLPHGCRIAEIRTAARRESIGEAAIPCSAFGISRTYAIHLKGTTFDRWLLVSGLSGEVTAIQNEAQLDAIFAATAARNESRGLEDAPGDDAD